LAWWRNEVAALYAGHPTHPVMHALAESIKHFSLPQEQLNEIIDGMEMDLDTVRYADFKALHLYCYRVASVVGLLSAEIFGYTDRHTLKYAHDLGLALQLTNIIRDVGEDARRGRIYLPQDELARFGVSEADILRGRDSDGFQALMAFQIARAREHYDRALAQLPACDRRKQVAGLIMAAIYRTTLEEIVKDGCRVLTHRLALPPLRKLWIAGRTWLAA
jgi:phytoene synthase